MRAEIEGIKRIAWLSSYPKSGNTLLRFLLSAYIDGGFLDINSPNPMVESGDEGGYFFHVCSPRPLQDCNLLEKILIRPAALCHILNKYDGFFFLKTHFINKVVGGISLIPHMISWGAIYIVRDPRSVALSTASHFGLQLSNAITAINSEGRTIGEKDQTFSYTGSWSEHVKSWLDQDLIPVYLVKYEDLVLDTHTTFKNILTWLGWEYNEETMQRSIEATKFDNLKKAEQERGFREASNKADAFFRKGKIDEWKGVLNKKQVNIITTKNQEIMKRLGYV